MDKMSYIIIQIAFVALIAISSLKVVEAGQHQDPPHQMIEKAYFKCEASKNLEGGIYIYGKGPFKRFGQQECLCSQNDWIRIRQEEFKELAAKWYGVDWSKEIPFWNQAR
jgi:hypothetical protein